MIKIEDKTKCTGCTACFAKCPVQCIQMVKDSEGFLYPDVDKKRCVNCHLCEKVCPINQEEESLSNLKMLRLACQNTNYETRIKSTSGGIFSAIAECVLEQNGVVIGAGFRSDDMHVIHKITRNKDDLKELRASKYVQSELGSTFIQIKDLLLQDTIPVFFVGTPCQTSGLLSFLGKDYPNLYTADLVCYGVPSPEIYDKWISMLEAKHKSKVREIYFRDKKYGYAGVNVKIILNNGKILEDRLDVKSFPKTFFSKIDMRPSCYNCLFRTRVKHCDFTFADFWEIGKYNKMMDDNIGTTHVMVHTDKGRKLIFNANNIQAFLIEELEGEDVKKYFQNQELERAIPSNRTAFFVDANNLSYSKLIDKYLPNTSREIIALFLKPVIGRMPPFISNSFFRMLKNRRRK